MDNLVSSFVDNTIQCWGCPVFDRLFQVISTAAASMYDYFCQLCIVLLVVFMGIHISNSVFQNLKNKVSDPFLKKSVQKMLFNALIAITLLGAGVAVPRLITTVVFEPVTSITTIYTQSLIKLDTDQVNEKVTYQPVKMADNGFYRPEFRDKVITLMKTTITQFQAYIKLGISIMDSAFTWKAFLSIGAIFKHIVLFFMGLFLGWSFFKLFFKYCCRFTDAIVAMALFAFFFPVSLVSMAFNGVEHVPEWIKKIGGTVGINQIKNLINSLVTLGSVVLTYTIIMVIIAKFFSSPDASVNDLMTAITQGDIFEAELDSENLYALTLTSCVVLIYVLDYIYEQIPKITKMVLDAFGVQEKNEYGDKVADTLMTLSKNAINSVATAGKIVVDGIRNKKDEGAKKEEPKSDTKKDSK